MQNHACKIMHVHAQFVIRRHLLSMDNQLHVRMHMSILTVFALSDERVLLIILFYLKD